MLLSDGVGCPAVLRDSVLDAEKSGDRGQVDDLQQQSSRWSQLQASNTFIMQSAWSPRTSWLAGSCNEASLCIHSANCSAWREECRQSNNLCTSQDQSTSPEGRKCQSQCINCDPQYAQQTAAPHSGLTQRIDCQTNTGSVKQGLPQGLLCRGHSPSSGKDLSYHSLNS